MPITGQLVERQMKRRDLDQQFLARCRQDEHEARPSVPLVTISRELGSGGRTIGKMVADMLGFAYYDKEIINQIAEKAGSSSHHIEHVESGSRDAVTSVMLNLLDRRHVPDTVYLRHLLKVLREIGEAGRAVIIGRGGSCVLRQALKVRVIAPFDMRVQRMAGIESVDPKEAEQRVLNYDHQQKRFLRTFFGCAPDDHYLFDLVISTEAMALEHAAELIVLRVRQLWPEGAPALEA